MRKGFALFLALALALAACTPKGADPTPTPPLAAEDQPAAPPATPEIPDESPEASAQPAQEPNGETSHVLVAYFSATGNTRPLAEAIMETLDADLFEIQPETPYTTEDLDWHDSSSRTTFEMNDPSARPAISGSVENMEDYDVIFLGYPIWWGEAPRIISTFLESYDFSGKTIVPFCTSGSSGYSDSAIRPLAADAVWQTGRRFSGGVSQSAVKSWIDSLNLALTSQ